MGVRLIKGKKGLTPTDLNKELDKFIKQNAIDNERLAISTQNHMRNYIASRVRRDGSDGNLEKNITVVKPTDKSSANYYVGDKDLLNRNAKYWYVLNYGVTITGKEFIPPANWGFFGAGDFPQTGINNQKWTHLGRTNKKFGYYLTPMNFSPINYIEAGANYLRQRWLQQVRKKKITRKS